MGIYQRHVVVEVVKAIVVALVAATGLLLVVGVLRAALEHGLGIAQALPLLPYVLPDAMRFAVPGALLLAVCNVYGRLSAGNELIALQALGVNVRTIVFPTLALTVLISLGTVFLNDDAVCWGHERSCSVRVGKSISNCRPTSEAICIGYAPNGRAAGQADSVACASP